MAVAPLIPLLAAGGKSAATAAVTSAAIGGGASLVGGALRSRGEGRASDAQERANQEALRFEREREATRKAEYERAQAQQKAFYDYSEAARLNLLRRYGIGGAPVEMGQAPGRGTPGALTLGRIAAGPAAPSPVGLASVGDWRDQMRPQGQTLAQLAGWDWGRR